MSWKLSFKFIIAHFLVPSIICFFFFALTTKWISFGSKTITRALSQIGLPSASAPVKVCQVFHAPLHPRPPHPSSTPPHPRQLPRLMEMLAAYRCWPVVLLFEMCSLYFSLEGNGDRLISPDAHSPGKKDKKKKIKKKRAREKRLKRFAASLSTFLQSWNPHWKKTVHFKNLLNPELSLHTKRC